MRKHGLTTRNAIVVVVLSTLTIVVIFAFLILGMNIFANGDAFSSAITSFFGASAGIAINFRATMESGDAQANIERLVNKLITAWERDMNSASTAVSLRDDLSEAVHRKMKQMKTQNEQKKDDAKSKRKTNEGEKNVKENITPDSWDVQNVVDKIMKESEDSKKGHDETLRKRKQKASESLERRRESRNLLKRKQILEKTTIFSKLSLSHIEAIIEKMHFKAFAGSQPLVQEGDDATELMVITKGEAVVTKKDTQDRVIRTLKAGDVLGEGALLAGDHIRGATVTANNSIVHALILSRASYESVMNSDTLNDDQQKAIVENMRKQSKLFSEEDAARLRSRFQ